MQLRHNRTAGPVFDIQNPGLTAAVQIMDIVKFQMVLFPGWRNLSSMAGRESICSASGPQFPQASNPPDSTSRRQFSGIDRSFFMGYQ